MKELVGTIITYFLMFAIVAFKAVVAQDISQWFSIPYLMNWEWIHFFGLVGVAGLIKKSSFDIRKFSETGEAEGFINLVMGVVGVLVSWGFFCITYLIFIK